MIEAIQVSATAAAQASSAATPALSPQASAYDIREFAAALERSGGAAPAAPAAQAQVVTPASLQPSEGTRAVLTALEHLNGGADKINAMSQVMSANSADLTPSEMMQMTMRCHQFLFQAELTSNVANRTSDGIQQLFRQQS
jgi:hypothetical protein